MFKINIKNVPECNQKKRHLLNCKHWNETEDQPYYLGCLS